MLRFLHHRATIVALVFCIVLWIYCFISLSHVLLVGGDAGQWVTMARFYIGEVIPAYKNPPLYPPIFPLLQALFLIVLRDVPLAVNVLGATVFTFTSFSFFVAGKELWNSRAGLFALMLGSLGQYFIIYFTAFGGFPQILAIGLANLVISYFIRIQKSSKHFTYKQGIILSLLLGVSFFTYAPFIPNLVVILSLPFIVMVFEEKRRQSINVKEIVITLLILSTPFIAYGLYASGHDSEFTSYTTNEAALYQRGLDQVSLKLFRHTESALVVIAGVFSTIIGLVWTLFRKKKESFGFRLTSWWLISIVSTMCCLYILRIGTDYLHGYTNLIVVPLVLNVAGFVSRIPEELSSRIFIFHKARRFHKKISTLVVITAFLSICVFLFPATHSFYVKALDYYSVSEPRDLMLAVQMIENLTLKNETILITPREGKWLEAFTGQAGLFTFPEELSFRSWQHNRSTAVDVLFSASHGIENGLVFVKYQEACGGSMFHPMISVYHNGEYIEALKIEDSLTAVRLTKSNGETLNIPFLNFRELSTDLIIEPDCVHIISKYEAELELIIQIEKSIEVQVDDGNVSISYEINVSEDARLESVSVGLLRSWGDIAVNVGKNPQKLEIVHTGGKEENLNFGHSNNQRVIRFLTGVSDSSASNIIVAQTEANKLEITHVSEGVVFTPSPGHNVIVWQTFFQNETSRANIQLTVSTTPTGRYPLIDCFQIYTAEELLETYQIGAVLLQKDGVEHFHRINLEYLGFEKVYENDSYIVMIP